MVPIRYPHFINGGGIKFHCLISVFANDGTISVAHSGIEMGQGLNTKVLNIFDMNLNVYLCQSSVIVCFLKVLRVLVF